METFVKATLKYEYYVIYSVLMLLCQSNRKEFMIVIVTFMMLHIITIIRVVY